MTQQLFRTITPRAAITFEVPGLPCPKGSKTGILINGEVRLIEGTSNAGRRALKEWQGVCEEVFRYQFHGEPLDEPIEAKLFFRFPVIESDPLRTRHTTKPDIDKLVRAVFDSLTKAGVWRDDALCCELATTKRYVAGRERPGVSVVLRGLAEEEREDRAVLKESTRRVSRR